MKKLLLLVIAVFLAAALSAENVDQVKVRKVAKAFAAQRDRNAAQLKTYIVYSHPMPNKRDAAFYVVNLGDTGFVIVSANDVAHPVIGYSFDSPWPTEGNIPPQITDYLDDLAGQIEAASQDQPDQATKTEWQELLAINLNNPPQPKGNRTEVGPLLTTTWDQGQYYNAMCPEDANGPDGHTLTGCVATALAQIIRYNQYPQQGRGVHSYNTNYYGGTYGILTVDYNNETYDYGNMPDALTNESTEEHINAVAQLMRDCGVAVNMQYTSYSSGTYDPEARAALINYFKYSPNMVFAERNCFTAEEWITLLQADLDDDRVIYYRGQGTGGHAFVCDGYNSEGYFSYNFGWSGSCNGWYLTDAVNPGGMVFSYGQEAILGIVPDTNCNVILAQMQGTSTFPVDEPIELYHTMGHNKYTGNGLEVSCQNDIVFCAQDTASRFNIELLHYDNFTLHIADGDAANDMVFMGQTLCTFAPTWTNYTGPIMSSTNAIACRYIGDMTYDGFCVRFGLNEDSCLMVTNVTSAVDTTSAKLSWRENGNANQWDVEYGNKGFVKGTGNTVTVDTTFIIVDGLEKLSTYDFYIRPICHEAWYGPVTVKTDLSYWQDYVTEEPEGCIWDENGNALVSKPEQLAWFLRDYGIENVIITSDLDMSGHRWKPVESYSGNVDGGNHTISNLIIREYKYEENVGFFRNIGRQCISNIVFINPYIFAKSRISNGYCGVLSGIADNEATIRNCGVVGGIIDCTAHSVGGLVGGIYYGGNIVNCFANININNHVAPHHTGGLVGSLYGYGNLLNCYSASSINVDYYYWDGQILAYNDGGSIEKCYGILSDFPQIEYNSGIGGYIRDTTAFESSGLLRNGVSFDSDTSFDLLEVLNWEIQELNDNSLCDWQAGNNINNGYPILGSFHTVTCPNVVNLRAKNVNYDDTYALRLEWDNPSGASSFVVRCINYNDTIGPLYFNTNNSVVYLNELTIGEEYKINVRAYNNENSYSGWGDGLFYIYDRPYWTDIITEQPEGYIVGANGDVVINSAEGLAWLSSCVNGLNQQEGNAFQGKTVTLTSDIDMGQYRWTPIGNGIVDFSGFFNGCGHTIDNLYANENNNMIGLFGQLREAKIINTTLKNTHIKGKCAVGGICGRYNSNWERINEEYGNVMIESCHVIDANITGTYEVGGLCGNSQPKVAGLMFCNNSTSGSVLGVEDIGGLIGLTNQDVLILRNCFSTANVSINLNGKSSGSYTGYMGGLAGCTYKLDTKNCYYAGHVEDAPSFVGVLFGVMQISSTEYAYGLADSTKYLATHDGAGVWQNNTAFTKEGNQCVFMDAITINDTPYTDLLSSLNAWVDANNANGEYLHWVADTENQNGGFPMLEQQPSAEYQIQQLASGWNWYSTYIEQNDADGLSMLESGLGSHGELIMSRTGAMVENFEGSFWWGDLNAVTNEEMYEIKTNAQTNVVMTGGKATPSSHPITVAPGWNWIGYVSNTSNSIANALSSLASNEDDIIQSRNAFSSYFPGYGWYGDLENMTPGQGYMYKSNGTASQTLVYPTASRSNESEAIVYHNQADYNRYRNVMDVMAKVIINGKPANSNRYELAAFVDGECRGRAKLQYVEPMDTYLAFITINGNDDETVTFNLYDEDMDVTYYASESNVVAFKANEVVGKFRSPYILCFNNAKNVENTVFTVYPNPAANGDEITINFMEDVTEATLFVENELGLTVDVVKLSGKSAKVRFDLPSGLYILRVVIDGNIYYNKLIVK